MPYKNGINELRNYSAKKKNCEKLNKNDIIRSKELNL